MGCLLFSLFSFLSFTSCGMNLFGKKWQCRVCRKKSNDGVTKYECHFQKGENEGNDLYKDCDMYKKDKNRMCESCKTNYYLVVKTKAGYSGGHFQLQEVREEVIVCPSCKAREEKIREEKHKTFEEKRVALWRASENIKERQRKVIVDRLIQEAKESTVKRKPGQFYPGARVRYKGHGVFAPGRKKTGTVHSVTHNDYDGYKIVKLLVYMDESPRGDLLRYYLMRDMHADGFTLIDEEN